MRTVGSRSDHEPIADTPYLAIKGEYMVSFVNTLEKINNSITRLDSTR